MYSKTPVLTFAALLVAGMTLAACDQDEQGRLLSYEKGTYLGEPDTPLTEEQVNELRHRAMQQAGG
ncbi:MAG: hypothetical protein OEU09_04890 [Rhodospirillales bacterium]|nr:hypothetical protein [Rhodospirillales bacterium]MDH3791457.1 hypothetical protein [Rhodospirillales bacterium]MDH3910613.1 hypothetical protein [Rhodospirillales bacterium]MDH3917196.1 hypothetical protein [Rhodospirillales bacterium]MDH3965898.1 hypothetical protein [Rhodospirillales bacterium]